MLNTQQQEQVLQTFRALASGLSREAKGERLHLLLVGAVTTLRVLGGEPPTTWQAAVYGGAKQTAKLFSQLPNETK